MTDFQALLQFASNNPGISIVAIIVFGGTLTAVADSIKTSIIKICSKRKVVQIAKPCNCNNQLFQHETTYTSPKERK